MPSIHTASPQPIRALLIDNNPADARLIGELLPDLRIDTVARLAGGLAYLARAQPDVILLALDLPDSQGIETIRRVRASAPGAAIVVLAQAGSEDVGVQAMHHGAQDYLARNIWTARPCSAPSATRSRASKRRPT